MAKFQMTEELFTSVYTARMLAVKAGKTPTRKNRDLLFDCIVNGMSNVNAAKKHDVKPQLVSRSILNFKLFYDEEYETPHPNDWITRTVSLPESGWEKVDEIIKKYRSTLIK